MYRAVVPFNGIVSYLNFWTREVGDSIDNNSLSWRLLFALRDTNTTAERTDKRINDLMRDWQMVLIEAVPQAVIFVLSWPWEIKTFANINWTSYGIVNFQGGSQDCYTP